MASSTIIASREKNLLDNLPESPHQPLSFNFPKRKFGKKTILERSFQASWFDRWTWLHYNEAEDCVHCFLCLKAVKLNHVAAKKDEAAFVSVLLSIFNISNSYNYFCVCMFLCGAKLTDALEMKEIANDFIGQNERRMQIFGKFT